MTRARDVANLIGSGNYSSTTFTATAGQTAFTIAHTQGFVQVFMNGLLLDETADYTSNGTAITLTSGAAAGDEIEVVKYNTFSVGDAVPASGGTFTGNVNIPGHVVQAQSTFYNTEQSITSTGYTDIMSVNITPASTSSKVLVIVHLQCTHQDFYSGLVKVLRDSTAIGGGVGGGSYDSNVWFNIREASAYHTQSCTGQFLDSPSTTSQITYKVQGSTTDAGYPTFINRTRDNTTSQRYNSNNGSSITVMEIAG